MNENVCVYKNYTNIYLIEILRKQMKTPLYLGLLRNLIFYYCKLIS